IFSLLSIFIFFFFFIYPPPSYFYTLSLHDALPISFYARVALIAALVGAVGSVGLLLQVGRRKHSPPLLLALFAIWVLSPFVALRSEEHTSELQSRGHLVCRLLLEKKKIKLAGSLYI